MSGYAGVRMRVAVTFVVALGLALSVVTAGCGPTPAPTLPTIEVAVTPTATSRLSTPTPTATWTPSPTPLPPLRWPTATETATAVNGPTKTATATVAPTNTSAPSPASTFTPVAAGTATSIPAPTLTPRPTSAPSSPWRGEYYANPDLGGDPALVRLDAAVAFDWQESSPAPQLGADGFSARWTRREWFESAVYTFYATMDDGMRVYVDGELIIDEWRDRAAREVTARREMSAGVHEVRVEYYERGHLAVARLWWAEDHSFVGWRGRYYADRELRGNPVIVRDDRVVSFDWGLGSPGEGLPEDEFSVVWTREMRLADGRYLFRALVDDGVRLWVDGVLVINDWRDGSLRELTADRTIAGTAPHFFQVEYYDNLFDARIELDWQRIGEPTYPYWKAEYFDNQHLSGAPALVLDERSISHDWGNGSPAPSLPVDRFSARWTRKFKQVPGRYRFRFKVDDGLRFYVDGALKIDQWHTAWGETYEVEVDLPEDPELRIEYFEDGGGAKMEFSYEKL